MRQASEKVNSRHLRSSQPNQTIHPKGAGQKQAGPDKGTDENIITRHLSRVILSLDINAEDDENDEEINKCERADQSALYCVVPDQAAPAPQQQETCETREEVSQNRDTINGFRTIQDRYRRWLGR